MKRYLLFIGEDNEEIRRGGGMYDFWDDYDTFDEAKEGLALAAIDDEKGSYWAQIYDCENRSIAWETEN